MKLALGLAATVLTLSACGGGSSSSTAADKPSSPPTTAPTKDPAEYLACRKAVGPLLAAEQELNGRLDVGLQFDDYTSRVGDVSVAYNQTSAKLTGDSAAFSMCINKVGIPLERVLNDYRQAGDIWNNCITSLDCSFDAGSPSLKRAQTKWSAATVALDGAQSHLDAMKP